ncbi:MAG: MFS transporter [Chloroflexota bacterium]|nr:MFS transporter [Chloroflexota bacterium]
MRSAQSGPPARPRLLDGLTRNVYVLGLVSLFTDISSEMIVPIRILFLVQVLGTPITIAGLIEGIAESTASLLKVWAGRLADRVPDRKPLILAGYGISNAVKPLLALAGSWPVALGLIFVDRVGKGVRGSPRDAVLADATAPAYRGKAFGFHRSMDTLGAAFGPLITFAILALTHENLRAVFAWTAIPGVLSVLVLVFFLRTERRSVPAKAPDGAAAATRGQTLAALGRPFWIFTAIATIFALGNSSDAFIFLRTEGLEDSLAAVPLVYFVFNLVYALLATPLGVLSDRWGRLPVLFSGYVAFALVYLGWANATENWHAWALFAIYGIYAAATEGVSKALVSDLIPKGQRGAAMGWFNGLIGLAALPANLLSGWLWSQVGPGAVFQVGAGLGCAAAGLLLMSLPWLHGQWANKTV